MSQGNNSLILYTRFAPTSIELKGLKNLQNKTNGQVKVIKKISFSVDI